METSASIKYSKMYVFSYCILMVVAALNSYSEFNSLNFIGKPAQISLIWDVGIVIFLVLQSILTIYNCKTKEKLYLFIFLLFTLLFLALKIKIITFSVFCLFLLIINSDLLDFKYFMKYDLIIRIFTLLSIIMMFFLGLFPAAYKPLTLSHGNVIRSTLGFNHPNTLGGYYIYLLIALILFIHSRKNIHLLGSYQKIFMFLFVALSGYYVEFVLSDSRSGEITLIVILPFLLLYMINRFNVPLLITGYMSFITIMVIFIALPYFFSFNNSFMVTLNKLLSNRLLLQNEALHSFSINLWGNSLFVQGKPFYIDNQYVFNLLAVGLIGSLLLLFIVFSSIKNAKRGNDFILFFIIIAVAIRATVESTEFDYYALLPFLYSFKYFWNKDKLNNLGDKI